MSDDQDRPMLRLKNGATVDARLAYADWWLLEGYFANEPQAFPSLVDVARNGKAAVAPAELERMQNRHREWFDEDGSLSPLVRDVLLSSFRSTAEGNVLVNPFHLADETERETLVKIERQSDLVLQRLRRGDNPRGR